MDKNQLTIVKKCENVKPLNHKIVFIIDNCYTGCHAKYVHTFLYDCIYDIHLTIITYIEIINLTFSDKSLGL